MAVSNALLSAHLLAHARASARADEDRHPKTMLHVERTLRGWGNAALADLEWASSCVYAPAQHAAYSDAYADEYRQARSSRMLRAVQ